MRTHPAAAATAATLAAAALLAGCSSGGSDLTVSGLRDKAAPAAKGAASCPVDYDIAAAARKAGLAGRTKDGRATAETTAGASADSPIAQAKGVDLECAYTVNGEKITVQTVAVEKGRAVYLMAPLIARDAALSSSQLRTYLGKAVKSDPHRAAVTPSGNVATVPLPASGTGDLALVTTFGADGKTTLTPHQVTVLAEALSHQATW